MTLLTVGPGRAGMFVPLAGLPHWSETMGQAEAAMHTGDLVQAQSLYDRALALVGQVMVQGHPAQACDCLAAWVSSSRCLSDLHTDLAHAHSAAEALAKAHTTLIALMVQHPRGSAWHEAAAWHSRETHGCLVEHWLEHGPDPEIERALRCACVALKPSNQPLH